MLGYIWRMLIGRFKSHEHKLKIIQVVNVVDENDIKIGQKFILQCTECGDIIKRET